MNPIIKNLDHGTIMAELEKHKLSIPCEDGVMTVYPAAAVSRAIGDLNLIYRRDTGKMVADVPTEEIVVDWATAPAWANFWALDQDGVSNWFEEAPTPWCNRWCALFDAGRHEYHKKHPYSFANWKETLRSRKVV